MVDHNREVSLSYESCLNHNIDRQGAAKETGRQICEAISQGKMSPADLLASFLELPGAALPWTLLLGPIAMLWFVGAATI